MGWGSSGVPASTPGMDWQTSTSAMIDLLQNTFGEDVVYKPIAGSEQTIKGIFGNASVSVDVGEGAATSSYAPSVGVKLSDLADRPRAGDQVEIRGNNYRVIDTQEDGEGGATLLLHRL